MNATSKDIQAMLEADVSVDTTTFPVFRAVIPEDEPDCTVIVDVASGAPQLTMDLAKYLFESVQIKVQCTDYDAGLVHANSIRDSLHGRAHETWNGTYYSVITCLNGPGFWERVNQRTIFIINFSIQRR